jgi:hypothetical protein
MHQSERFDRLDEQTQQILVALLRQRSPSNEENLQDQNLAIIQILARMEARILNQLRKDGVILNATKLDVSLESEMELRSTVGRQILQTLSFPMMTERRDGVAEAHKKTFQWIFEDPPSEEPTWSTFPKWLASGSGIYWINGKAGSGKSTLMRFIELDHRTEAYLKKWAGDMPLCSASFFFWNSDTTEQKSQSGLLRSLLYEILLQQPAMIPKVLPWFWARTYSKSSSMQPLSADFHWSLALLARAFKTLVQEPDLPFKLCLFIDGIDEYEGDHEEMSELLKASTSANIKICLSSRPWHVFEICFASFPSLRLQDIMRKDIEAYVHDKLNQNHAYKELAAREPLVAPALVSEITGKADGVFLWVEIVLKSLLQGLKNLDNISHLRTRLEALPKKLEDLYRVMFNRIDKTYLVSSAQTFQIVRAARAYKEHFHSNKPQSEALPIIALYFAINSDIDIGTVHTYESSNIKTRAAQKKVHLNVQCVGLLEAWKHKSSRITKIHYLHRTAREFIESSEIWDIIQGRTSKTGFDANSSMMRSCICQIALFGINYLGEASDRSKVLDLSRDAIIFAFHTDRQKNRSYITLIDQLDPVVTQLLLTKQGSHWANEFNGLNSTIDSLLPIAIQSDLSLYVEHQLRSQSGLIHPRNLTLLLQNTVPRVAITQRLPFSSATAAVLLNLQADPNQKEDGYSIWEKSHYVLYKHWASPKILRDDAKGRTAQEARNAINLFDTFVKYRANPKTYIIVGDYEKISLSTLEVMDRTVGKDFPEEVENAKKAFVRQGVITRVPRTKLPLIAFKKEMHLWWLDPE